MRPLFRTAAALLALPLAPLAAGQTVLTDVPDFGLDFAVRPGPTTYSRMLDMVYAETGDLVTAHVESEGVAEVDRIVVTRIEPSGQVEVLARFETAYQKVLSLQVALPELARGFDPERDRLYVAAHLANDPAAPNYAEAVALFSGPWFEPWGNSLAHQAFSQTVQGQLPRPWSEVNPVVCVLPQSPRDFSEHIVELAWAVPEPTAPNGSSVWRAQSFDYGATLVGEERIAGALGGPWVTPELDGMVYRRPSLCADAFRSRALLALEDGDSGRVHVLEGWGGGGPYILLDSTRGELPDGTPVRDHAPAIEANDGDAFLAFRQTPISGWQSGPLSIAGLERFSSTLAHHGPIAPFVFQNPDVSMREGEVYVACRLCLTGPLSAGRPRVWSGNLKGQGRWSPRLVDIHSTSCWQPAVAVTRGPGARRESLGVGTSDGWIDPSTGSWIWGANHLWINR